MKNSGIGLIIEWRLLQAYAFDTSMPIITTYRPGAARDDMHRRRWQFDSRRIYVRLRTGPQSAHLWWPAVAKLQAASLGQLRA